MNYTPWVNVPVGLARVPQAAVPARVPPPVLRTRRLGDLDPVVTTGLTDSQKIMLGVHGLILLAVAYHGYRRNNNSLLWGAAWGVGGVVCPSVTLAFALSSGIRKFAKPAKAAEAGESGE